MRWLWLPLCLLTAARCNGQVELAESNKPAASYALTELLRKVKDLRRDQEALEIQAINISAKVKERILNLNNKLDVVMGTMNNYQQNWNATFEPWRTMNCPKKKIDRISNQNLTCPYNSCFEKLLIKESSANSIRRIKSIPGVTNLASCVLFCRKQRRCEAVRYNDTKRHCTLLTQYHTSVEPTGRTVEVWAKSNSRLGKCRKSYNIHWQTSRYRFVRMRSDFMFPSLHCNIADGKLAELTSKAEIDRLAKEGMASSLSHWFVGAKKYRGSWRWYKSRIPIPTDGFRWVRQPTDMYGRRYVTARKKNGKLYFTDVKSDFSANGYLCECIEFPR